MRRVRPERARDTGNRPAWSASAAGFTLLSVVQSRPRPAREIRLTVTPNALPARRASTLAVDRTRAGADLPGRGGPADPAILAASRPNDRPARTHVPGGPDGGALVAFPIARRIEAGQAVTPDVPVVGRAPTVEAMAAPVAVAVAVAERPPEGASEVIAGAPESDPIVGRRPWPSPVRPASRQRHRPIRRRHPGRARPQPRAPAPTSGAWPGSAATWPIACASSRTS